MKDEKREGKLLLPPAQSITNKERIVSMDIVRGIALMGIIFVNAPTYNTPLLEIGLPVYSSDQYLGLFYNLFIQTKLYSIISFLFGLGRVFKV